MHLALHDVWEKWVMRGPVLRLTFRYNPSRAHFTHPVPRGARKGLWAIQADEKPIYQVEVT